MGVKLEEISYCLNMDSLINPNNIIILLPIYCKRLLVLPEDEGKYLARFHIHRSLVSKLKAKVKVFPNGELHKPKCIEIFDLSSNDNFPEMTEMVTSSIPMIPALEIKQNDFIK